VVQHDGASPGHQLDRDLDRKKNERRNERDDECEEHDVRRSRAAHRKELGVLAEDVEERLRQREARSRKQLSAAHRGLAPPRCGANAGSRDRGCVFHWRARSALRVRS
jgi:hypothetical protein